MVLPETPTKEVGVVACHLGTKRGRQTQTMLMLIQMMAPMLMLMLMLKRTMLRRRRMRRTQTMMKTAGHQRICRVCVRVR
jgi:hypothetical protein